MDKIPPELWVLITEYLPPPTLFRLRKTCKLFRILIKKPPTVKFIEEFYIGLAYDFDPTYLCINNGYIANTDSCYRIHKRGNIVYLPFDKYNIRSFFTTIIQGEFNGSDCIIKRNYPIKNFYQIKQKSNVINFSLEEIKYIINNIECIE